MPPTTFRWLWYLVGLAGMALAIVGAIALVASIVAEGLLVPLVVLIGLAILGIVAWRRRGRDSGPNG